MTKEEILNGMSEEEFYKLYPTEEAYFMAKGGSLSGAPHNGQPTADEFFSYGAPALGHMNIPMSNPTYLAHGGTYFGGPTRPYAYGGDLPMAQKGKSHKDSVAHQADKILKYEQLRGGPGGTPLSYYGKPKYKKILMDEIYPEVNKIMPNASAIEKGEAMDLIFNAGWDTTAKKILVDPRAYALQEYYRKNDKSKLDAKGKWPGRKGDPYSFDQEYKETIENLPENERRVLMNKGRDWFYQNRAPKKSNWDLEKQGPYPDYANTWYGRIWNTNDYSEFDPKNPKFTPKKKAYGGGLPGGANDIPCMNCGGYMDMGGYNSPTNYGSFSVPMYEGGEDSNDPPTFKPLSPKDSIKVVERKQLLDEMYPKDKYYFKFIDKAETNLKPVLKKTNRVQSLKDEFDWQPDDRFLGKLFEGKDKYYNQKALQQRLAEEDLELNRPRRRDAVLTETQQKLDAQDKERIEAAKRAAQQKQEYGGILDASNNQDYPIMDQGGRSNLMKIIKAAGKKLKKEYAAGGNTTMQGGNQDYLTQRNSTYDNFLKQNVYNSLVDQEQEDISKAFMRMGGLPKAQFNNQPQILNPKPVEGAGVFQNQYSFNQNFGQPSFTTPQSIGQSMGPTVEMQGQTNNVVPKQANGTKTVEPSNWEEILSNSLQTIGRQAIPIANKWAERLENKPSEMAKQKDIMNRLITPGSDLSAFQAKPANAMNRGDYDPNSGMFRPNQMVPVQFPGGMYNDYGRAMAFGGTYEEGEEYELSQEEIDELRNQGYELEELD